MPKAMIVDLDDLPGGLGTPIIEDDSVKFHEDHDRKDILLPYGTNYEFAMEVLKRKMQDEESVINFSRSYRYRPMDGAYATMMVLREIFGITKGKGIPRGFFGEEPPEMRTVEIGPNETRQVPWGCIQIPMLQNANLYTGIEQNPEFGITFKLMVEGKKKFKEAIEDLFDRVAAFLRENSIYRGKALIGHEEPKFLDLSEFRPERVIYSERVMKALEATVFSVIRHTAAFRREGVPRKRAILLHGPYGTGKTLTGQLVAYVCQRAQVPWTFIAAKPGEEDLIKALQTARLYEPACVFFEDVDETASTPDREEMSRLMEVFDGISAKGGELMAVMTTNHLDKIAKPLLRPGRLDALVEIEHLDEAGVERLVKSLVPMEKLDEVVDWEQVHEAMKGYYPAFIAEVCTRASAVGLGRSGGEPDYVIGTEDLCTAAFTLRPQFEQMERANEGRKTPELEDALRAAMTPAVEDTLSEALITAADGDGSLPFKVEVGAANGR